MNRLRFLFGGLHMLFLDLGDISILLLDSLSSHLQFFAVVNVRVLRLKLGGLSLASLFPGLGGILDKMADDGYLPGLES